MKNRTREQKLLFTLLMAASVLAIALGAFLGLSLPIQAEMNLALPVLGLLLWAAAWGAFLRMCLHLRRGESAFTPSTGKALAVIERCLTALAAVTFLCAYFGSTRTLEFLLMEALLLPGVFLAAALAARILRSLLTHAKAIEQEQEGVV